MGEIMATNWKGLYGESWSGVITADAIQHPAKFSRALIRKIYQHAQDEGWVTRGDAVVDPFGGVALGAFDAMRMGLNWHGVELEQKFVELGNQNIALWNERYSRFPQWGQAVLIQGDSRRLSEVISESGMCVSSPPFCAHTDSRGADHPYQTGKIGKGRWGKPTQYAHPDTDGNLGNLKATDKGFEMAVSSPPWMQSLDRGVVDKNERRRWAREHGISNAEHVTPVDMEAHRLQEYGQTEGQLGSMREGDHALCVTSPPYEHSSYYGLSKSFAEWREMNGRSNDKPGVRGVKEGYGSTGGQLAGSGDFWSASRQILEQLHMVLSPNAHAIFVVKDFIRNKKRVPFTEQWAELCEAVGFQLVHHHRAWLVEAHGAQGNFLTGEDDVLQVERKSFFRRLAEKKGSPRIDYESVLCFDKV